MFKGTSPSTPGNQQLYGNQKYNFIVDETNCHFFNLKKKSGTETCKIMIQAFKTLKLKSCLNIRPSYNRNRVLFLLEQDPEAINSSLQ